MKQSRTYPVSCNRDCITGCPLEAVVEEGVLTKIRNNPQCSAYMNGCMRGFRFPSVVYHPDRLTRPMIAVDSAGADSGSGTRQQRRRRDFRPASWDEALDLVAARLQSTHTRKGPAAVMRIGGSGACRGALHNTAQLTKRFLALAGGFTDTYGSYSSEATDYVKPLMYGTAAVGIDVKTLRYSELILLWGFNAADTRFGPETEAVLSEAKQRGTRIVVIDPRRTRTVRRFADWWIPVYPGTDTALMQALLFCILRDGLEDRSFIEAHSVGFDELEAHIRGKDGSPPKNPAWAAGLCGVSPTEIERLARWYAVARPAALLPGLSIQRTLGGEQADRMGGVLQLALGNVGRPGGSTGAGQWNVLPGPRCGKLPVPPNPAGSRVPVYRWADAVLEGRRGGYPADIDFLYNVGGNYAVQSSELQKVLQAFDAAEFVVTHDYFMTDTARLSDVVLPVTTFVERSDIIFSHTNYLYYSAAAIAPVGGARNDWDIFTDLAGRLGFGAAFTGGKTAGDWIAHFLRHSEVDDISAFFKNGIYAGEDQYRVGLSGFARSPEEYPLATESGKIEVACRQLEAAGGGRIPVYSHYREAAEFPLRLITPHERFRNNSQFDNVDEFARSAEEGVRINPQDAADRGIEDGDAVIVISPSGRMYSIARLSSDILAGVISCTQGRWFRRIANETEKFQSDHRPEAYSAMPFLAVNVLTSSRPTLPSRGSRTHSVMVNICKREEHREPGA